MKAILLAVVLLAVPLAAVVTTPTADACIQVYIGFDAGPLRYEQRSPCSQPQLYLNDDPLLP